MHELMRKLFKKGIKKNKEHGRTVSAVFFVFEKAI